MIGGDQDAIDAAEFDAAVLGLVRRLKKEGAMSNRLKPGDTVWKKAGAGFSGAAGLGMIPVDSCEPEPCFECGDPDCQEWPDVWPIDAEGKPTGGNWCHVSECQMIAVKIGPASDWVRTVGGGLAK